VYASVSFDGLVEFGLSKELIASFLVFCSSGHFGFCRVWILTQSVSRMANNFKCHKRTFSKDKSSTSKCRVELGGIVGGL